MRKLLFGALAIFLIAGCSGKVDTEKARQDSIRMADSIARVEAAEQARLDSIRQDSIKNAELEAFNINLFVTPFKDEQFGVGLMINSDNQISKALTNLGFKESKTVTTKYEEICGEYTSWKSTKYTFNKTIGDETIVINSEDTIEIIFPNAEYKDKFMKSAIAAGYKKSGTYDGSIEYRGPSECYYNGSDISVQGNTVTITYRSEC